MVNMPVVNIVKLSGNHMQSNRISSSNQDVRHNNVCATCKLEKGSGLSLEYRINCIFGVASFYLSMIIPVCFYVI